MTAIHSHLERPEWRWSKCHRPCQHRPLSKTRCGDPDVTGWGTPTLSKLVLHKPMAVPKFWETARLGMNHVEFSYLQKNGWVASYAWTSWSQKVMGFFKLFFPRFWTAAVGGFPRGSIHFQGWSRSSLGSGALQDPTHCRETRLWLLRWLQQLDLWPSCEPSNSLRLIFLSWLVVLIYLLPGMTIPSDQTLRMSGWSSDKKSWCCAHETRGCPGRIPWHGQGVAGNRQDAGRF